MAGKYLHMTSWPFGLVALNVNVATETKFNVEPTGRYQCKPIELYVSMVTKITSLDCALESVVYPIDRETPVAVPEIVSA